MPAPLPKPPPMMAPPPMPLPMVAPPMMALRMMAPLPKAQRLPAQPMMAASRQGACRTMSTRQAQAPPGDRRPPRQRLAVRAGKTRDAARFCTLWLRRPCRICTFQRLLKQYNRGGPKA
jgi:hypothetical protein